MHTLLVAGAFVLGDAGAFAQLPAIQQGDAIASLGVGGGPAAISGQENGSANLTASPSAGNMLTSSPMSADQITDLLEENPDLMLELKSMLADRMQEQGNAMDASDISDEMLNQQIAANPALRANVTTYLQAHGFTSETSPLPSQSDLSSIGGGVGSRSMPSSSGAHGIANSESELGMGEAIPSEPLAGARAEVPATMSSDSTPLNPRRGIVHSSTDAPNVLHRPPPYDLQSMRDLYVQVPDSSAQLRRFGSDVFVHRNVSAALHGVSGALPLDVPLGPDYVVGPGDLLAIDIWGGVTLRVQRTIGRDGRLLLPEAGSVQVAGLPLGKAQAAIEAALKSQYRDAQVAVTISQLHSVRVYVVGDVQRPGGYDISALATPVSALYAAGGPTAVGSLRVLHHLRGEKLVEDIDLYDFLLHGMRTNGARFESGDTLQVPPAGAQVAIRGAVKRPAIYEMKDDAASLGDIIDEAGGLTASAELSRVEIERIDANQRRETLTVPVESGDLANEREALAAFKVRDGDNVRVETILPYSQRAIYLEGHVVRPGRRSYVDGMRLGDVLQSYRDLLPEPSTRGEVVRLVAPDLHAETIDFDVPSVLIGDANFLLQPFDTIRIFGRYEDDVPRAVIRGEVLRPGTYPLSQGMTAAQLVRQAGGFKRDALQDSADLTSYSVLGGNRVVETSTAVRIGAAVQGNDPGQDVPLKPGDILSIHQITGWNDIGESVTIEGEVRFPGTYGFKDGEHLSSVLRRAGGMLPVAYPMGAVLVREQVRELEQKSRDELIRQIETNSAAARLSPGLAGAETSSTLQLIKAQQEQVLADLRSHPPTGRMVIHISPDIDSWANTQADIELRRGDVLTIPKQPGFVLVTGQVYNATALTFSSNKTAGWYLSRAGGTNSTANRREIFIIRANGSVVGRHSGGWFEDDVLSTRLNPGDVIVVPQKIIGSSLSWRNLLTTAQLASSIAITAAVAGL